MPGAGMLSGIVIGMVLFTMTFSALAHAETISVEIDGESYDVVYDAAGMTVSGVAADLDLISLILTVDVPEPQATLDITFDRMFFDSVIDGQDYGFLVLSDGDNANFVESQADSTSRTLSISLPIGTEEVEIVGSMFGPSPVDAVPDPVPDPVSGQTPVQTAEPDPTSELPEDPDPALETPVVPDTSMVKCGDGTVLEDGICVLDERCGDGTVLEDGICVLAPPAQRGLGGDLAAGSVGGFIAAGIIAVLAIIVVKMSRRKN